MCSFPLRAQSIAGLERQGTHMTLTVKITDKEMLSNSLLFIFKIDLLKKIFLRQSLTL